jgi:putative ABC transport system substrate-binding protein
VKRRAFITLLGGATAWPLATRAQQPTMPVVGFLSSGALAALPPHFIAAFRDGLAEAGFIDGKNIAIEFRFADQHLERVPALAMD